MELLITKLDNYRFNMVQEQWMYYNYINMKLFSIIIDALDHTIFSNIITTQISDISILIHETFFYRNLETITSMKYEPFKLQKNIIKTKT